MPEREVRNIAPAAAGDEPGVHALVIGVSAYTYLANGTDEVQRTHGLGQLDSAAQTAALVADWLLAAETRLRQPLKSLRLLASPSYDERHALMAKAAPATLENVRDALWQWRADAAKDPNGTTIFYFAGHGIQRGRNDSLLLLEDFLQPQMPVLGKAVDLSTIYNGMAEPDYPGLAQLQLYFVDACRTDLADMRKFLEPEAAPVWDITLGGMDTRVAPIFFASAAGTATFGSPIPGGVSAFGRDFLASVRGGAADNIRVGPGRREWSVTIGTLAQTLQKFVEGHNSTVAGRPRMVVVDKFTRNDHVIARLPGPPVVKCRIIFVPKDAHNVATLSFADATGKAAAIGEPVSNPHGFEVPAGTYRVSALVPAAHGPRYRDSIPEHVTVLPPETEVTVFLGDDE